MTDTNTSRTSNPDAAPGWAVPAWQAPPPAADPDAYPAAGSPPRWDAAAPSGYVPPGDAVPPAPRSVAPPSAAAAGAQQPVSWMDADLGRRAGTSPAAPRSRRNPLLLVAAGAGALALFLGGFVASRLVSGTADGATTQQGPGGFGQQGVPGQGFGQQVVPGLGQHGAPRGGFDRDGDDADDDGATGGLQGGLGQGGTGQDGTGQSAPDGTTSTSVTT